MGTNLHLFAKRRFSPSIVDVDRFPLFEKILVLMRGFAVSAREKFEKKNFGFADSILFAVDLLFDSMHHKGRIRRLSSELR